LFLGAGVSSDSGAPTGPELACELDRQFLDGARSDESFQTIAALVDAKVGRQQLNEYLEHTFDRLEPSTTLIGLTHYRWRRIYTVNFDTLLERAYDMRFASQKLHPIYSNHQRMTSPAPDVVPLYKLHGCISRTMFEDGRLTLTQEDHISNESGRLRMLNQLSEDLTENSFLYVGFRREDPDFIRILSYLRQQMPDDLRRGYALVPNVTDLDMRRWEAYRIQLIEGTAASLVSWIGETVRPTPRVAATPPRVVPTEETYAQLTLDEWEDAFWGLYGGYDRELPLYDIMLQLVNDGSHTAEAARKHDFAEAIPYVARMFSWLCTMVTKVRVQAFHDLSNGTRLSDLIWVRYPRLCCLCGRQPCVCGSDVDYVSKQTRQAMEEAAERRFQESRQLTRPDRLDEWVEMFDHIYGQINQSKSLEDKTFHLLEEIGEVEQELRKADRIMSGAIPRGQEVAYREIDWEAEVADVFSRLTSLIVHIRHSIDKRLRVVGDSQAWIDGELSLPTSGLRPTVRPFSYWLWRAFSEDGTFGCHRCHEPVCICLPPIRR
jgi:NTP pyrophosphatase (non-canonical NTP hydrolase)